MTATSSRSAPSSLGPGALEKVCGICSNRIESMSPFKVCGNRDSIRFESSLLSLFPRKSVETGIRFDLVPCYSCQGFDLIRILVILVSMGLRSRLTPLSPKTLYKDYMDQIESLFRLNRKSSTQVPNLTFAKYCRMHNI